MPDMHVQYTQTGGAPTVLHVCMHKVSRDLTVSAQTASFHRLRECLREHACWLLASPRPRCSSSIPSVHPIYDASVQVL